MSKPTLKASRHDNVIEIAASPAAVSTPAQDPWAKARRFYESASLFQRASLAAQIMCGFELIALHKAYDVKAGRKDKNQLPQAVVIKWPEAVKEYLGCSDQTAYRFMDMARTAKPRLAKGDLDLGALLEKHPGALTPAEQELLKKAVHKISDGRTQMEFLLECGSVKAPQGSAVKGGDTRKGDSAPVIVHTAACSPVIPGWEPRAQYLNGLLAESLIDGWWNECDEAQRRELHGNLLDAVRAVAATLKDKSETK